MIPLTNSGLYPVVKSLGPFVPTSPMTLEMPVFVFAPLEVKRAKQPALLRIGAVGPFSVVLPHPLGMYANNSVTVIAP